MSLIKREHTALEPLSHCDTYIYCKLDLLEVSYRDVVSLLRDPVMKALEEMDDIYGYTDSAFYRIIENILYPTSHTYIKLDMDFNVVGLMVWVESTSVHIPTCYSTYVNYNVEGSYFRFYKTVRNSLITEGVRDLYVGKRVGNTYVNRFVKL